MTSPRPSIRPDRSKAWDGGKSADQLLLDFLLANIQAIALDEAAAALKADIRRLRRKVERAIDNADPGVFCGPCDAPNAWTDLVDGTVYVETRACGRDLMAHFGDALVTCDACGTEYSVESRKAQMLEQVRDMWAIAPVIANGLTGLSMPVTASMIRQMAFRKEIFKRVNPDPDDDTVYYLVRDVEDVLLRRAERKASKEGGRKRRMSA